MTLKILTVIETRLVHRLLARRERRLQLRCPVCARVAPQLFNGTCGSYCAHLARQRTQP